MSPLAVAGAVVGGKYRLDAIIGYGGMGQVWAATHLGVGREVAIKVIASSYSKSVDVRRRFDTEAKAVASLKSRHVVQVYDNGELEDGTPFIAMELLRGESLHSRVHRTGPIALPETAKILMQVCRALSKSHALGIVHRDIKPENIFLAQSEDDNEYVVKVLDFGIAKLSAEGHTSSTQTGTLLGTPLYMSPEQARGLKSIDHRTDIYSLGLVAYTMLTGNLAFTSESFGDLLLQICTQPLPVPTANASWLPPAIDPWFDKACAREPQHRFATALELAEGLAIVAGASTSQLRLSSEPAVSVPHSAVAAPVSRWTGVAMAPTLGTDPGTRGSVVMSPVPAPSLVAPMTLSGAQRPGPGVAVVVAAFAVVAALAVVGVFAARYFLFRGDARQATGLAQAHASSTPTALDASAGAEAPTAASAAASADVSPALAVTASAVPTAVTTVAPPPPVQAGHGRPHPPPPPTGKPKVDLGY